MAVTALLMSIFLQEQTLIFTADNLLHIHSYVNFQISFYKTPYFSFKKCMDFYFKITCQPSLIKFCLFFSI